LLQSLGASTLLGYRLARRHVLGLDLAGAINRLGEEDPRDTAFLRGGATWSHELAPRTSLRTAAGLVVTRELDGAGDASQDPVLPWLEGTLELGNDAPRPSIQLALAVEGGRTEDSFPIKPLTLNDDPRIAEFFFTYGLALARTNQCGKALPISQTLQTKFPSDDIVMEAANSIVQICQENLDNPATETPVATEAATALPEATDTPEATSTPESTTTP
jgi:hypothetical protein